MNFLESFVNERNSKTMQIDEVPDKVRFINVPYENGAIVLMNHPATFIVYKYVSVKVLTGTVSVNGFEITKRTKPIEVFSSEKTGLIEIKTENFERIWKKKARSTNLEQLLLSIMNSVTLVRETLKKFENSTVAIFIKRCPLPYNVDFVELYYPEAFQFSICKKSGVKENFYVPRNKVLPLCFGLNEEKLASEINVLIRSAKLTDSDNPRILICGPRNTGKSTLLHFLINKILSLYQRAYYLDTDPGQPEFTPPGVVSLTEVRDAITGPPFIHQQTNSKMMFTGSISPSFIDLYNKNVRKLMELYSEDYADEPLFVNTMGWMEGTGLQCLINTIAAVKPTVLIEIVTSDETSMFDYRNYISDECQYFQICCSHERKTYFTAKEMRELSLLSYLGKCQSSFLGPLLINEIQPYCVSWEKIPVFIFPGGNVLPSRMIEAVNESIVALCTVPESAILESNIPEFSKTLETDPENECLAYGLVQAVDEKERLLYIISPLKKHNWAKVNAIIKGNIMVPDAVILEQEIYEKPLPHITVRETSPPNEEMMDVSMLSLKYISEIETESPAANAYASVENYRKKIPPRHRRHSKKL